MCDFAWNIVPTEGIQRCMIERGSRNWERDERRRRKKHTTHKKCRSYDLLPQFWSSSKQLARFVNSIWIIRWFWRVPTLRLDCRLDRPRDWFLLFVSRISLVHRCRDTWPDVGLLPSRRFRSLMNNTVSPRTATLVFRSILCPPLRSVFGHGWPQRCAHGIRDRSNFVPLQDLPLPD